MARPVAVKLGSKGARPNYRRHASWVRPSCAGYRSRPRRCPPTSTRTPWPVAVDLAQPVEHPARCRGRPGFPPSGLCGPGAQASATVIASRPKIGADRPACGDVPPFGQLLRQAARWASTSIDPSVRHRLAPNCSGAEPTVAAHVGAKSARVRLRHQGAGLQLPRRSGSACCRHAMGSSVPGRHCLRRSRRMAEGDLRTNQLDARRRYPCGGNSRVGKNDRGLTEIADGATQTRDANLVGDMR